MWKEFSTEVFVYSMLAFNVNNVNKKSHPVCLRMSLFTSVSLLAYSFMAVARGIFSNGYAETENVLSASLLFQP